MRPKYIEVPLEADSSFRVTDEEVPHFYNPLHYHRELELTHVLQGHGTRFVGDSLEPFGPGELVLVGSNLPHCWRNAPEYFEKGSKLTSQAIVVQFGEDFSGTPLFNIPELRRLKLLLLQASRGIKFGQRTIDRASEKLARLSQVKHTQSVAILLEVLDILAVSDEKSFLSSIHLNEGMIPRNLERLNAVIEFTIENIGQRISLAEVADRAHLTPSAFCRYFKSHTRKTYTTFVNELRIKNAAVMLRETAKSIGDIAFENGFNSQVHFNRTFKKVQGIAPQSYRKRYRNLPFTLP